MTVRLQHALNALRVFRLAQCSDVAADHQESQLGQLEFFR
jgi:hypothetical protein